MRGVFLQIYGKASAVPHRAAHHGDHAIVNDEHLQQLCNEVEIKLKEEYVTVKDVLVRIVWRLLDREFAKQKGVGG